MSGPEAARCPRAGGNKETTKTCPRTQPQPPFLVRETGRGSCPQSGRALEPWRWGSRPLRVLPGVRRPGSGPGFQLSPRSRGRAAGVRGTPLGSAAPSKAAPGLLPAACAVAPGPRAPRFRGKRDWRPGPRSREAALAATQVPPQRPGPGSCRFPKSGGPESLNPEAGPSHGSDDRVASGARCSNPAGFGLVAVVSLPGWPGRFAKFPRRAGRCGWERRWNRRPPRSRARLQHEASRRSRHVLPPGPGAGAPGGGRPRGPGAQGRGRAPRRRPGQRRRARALGAAGRGHSCGVWGHWEASLGHPSLEAESASGAGARS